MLGAYQIHDTGIRHGTLLVIAGGEGYEVTTFRTEAGYSDHRHPDSVRFVRSLEEDLARRDFTVNAMAFHPERGLVDPFGGRADLERGLIRAVGEPELRFREDALRILRALRFTLPLLLRPGGGHRPGRPALRGTWTGSPGSGSSPSSRPS